MINSLVLQSYSPIIVPLSFIYGISFSEKELLYGKVPIIGLFGILIAFLVYYDRVENKKKEYLIPGLFGLMISYLMTSYSNRYLLNTLLLFVSLCLIGYGVTDLELYSYRNQYIYLSLFIMFVSMSLLLPYERKYLQAYSLSLVSIAISITILVFVTVKVPEIV